MSGQVIVSPVETAEDLKQAFHCLAESFGRQARDAVWMITNPGWDTKEGQEKNVTGLVKRWESITTNKNGKPNTIFLKATLPDPNALETRKVVGFAIWAQYSYVEGYGDPFTGDLGDTLDHLEPADRRFAKQALASLWKRRVEVIKEVSSSNRNPPAILTLDICGVDPAFSRRGIASKLVERGLEEAKNRGGLECTTEGSAMGRTVYRRLGFKDEGVGDIIYEVDEDLKDRDTPPNVFLRTGL